MSEPRTSSNAARGCIVLVFLVAVIGIIGVGIGAVFWTASSPTAEVLSAPAPVPADGAAPGGGAALDRIRTRGALLVGMDTGEPAWSGTPPMFFLDDNGGYAGFDSVVAKQIATAAGVSDVKIVHAKYSGLEELLLDPAARVDVVVSGYSPTDTAGLVWSEPYLD